MSRIIAPLLAGLVGIEGLETLAVQRGQVVGDFHHRLDLRRGQLARRFRQDACLVDQRGRRGRQVALEQLVLQGARSGRDQGALTTEQGRHQIRQCLAGSGGAGDQAMAVRARQVEALPRVAAQSQENFCCVGHR